MLHVCVHTCRTAFVLPSNWSGVGLNLRAKILVQTWTANQRAEIPSSRTFGVSVQRCRNCMCAQYAVRGMYLPIYIYILRMPVIILSGRPQIKCVPLARPSKRVLYGVVWPLCPDSNICKRVHFFHWGVRGATPALLRIQPRVVGENRQVTAAIFLYAVHRTGGIAACTVRKQCQEFLAHYIVPASVLISSVEKQPSASLMVRFGRDACA